MDEIVIVGAKRTPIGKAGRGFFKDTLPADILYFSIKGVLDSIDINPELIDECVYGNVLLDLGGTVEARAANLAAGLKVSTPVMTVNRQCASGLESIDIIASKIRTGKINVGIAGGFESMSAKHLQTKATFSESMLENENIRDCLLPMGITAENIAEKYSINRVDADYFACESQIKASAAKQNDIFNEELVSINDLKKNNFDEGIRPTDLNSLGKLKPCFKENGVCTAGNSSQLSDASACVILMKRRQALELNLTILAVFVDYVTIGCDPKIMGVGPCYAIPILLKRNNLTIEDIEVFEINEAFATQAVYCIEMLNIDPKKVNIFGGAIALGHPLGATGTRLVVSIINIMKRNGYKLGVVSMCVGTGMGVAALIKIN